MYTVLHNGNSYFTYSHTADQYDTAQMTKQKKKERGNWGKIQAV